MLAVMVLRSIDHPQEWLSVLGDERVTIQIGHARHKHVSPRWHTNVRQGPFQSIWFVGSGNCEGRVEDIPIQLTSGDFLWINSSVMREFWLKDPRKPCFLSALRFRLMRGNKEFIFNRTYTTAHDAWEVQPYLQKICEETYLDLPYQQDRIRSFLVIVFASIFRISEARHSQVGILNQNQKLKLTHYMENHAEDRVRPAHLAKELGFSSVYFARLFRRTWKVSPRVWIKREKIRQAAQLLSDSKMNVTEIANHVGFSDIYFFSRQFKSVMGCSPRAYRKNN